MKRVRAFHKETGEMVGALNALSITEDTRRAYDWRCIETGCDCKMHWRKAVLHNGNTDPDPPTFVKNRSSAHKAACPADITRIYHDNIEYVTLKDGKIHLRINFPLGSDNVDRYPQRGYLTQQQLRAAHNHRDIKPFSSLDDLLGFVEKNFGRLDTEHAEEIVVMYQGQFTEFGKLLRRSDQYAKLQERASKVRFDKETDGKTRASAIMIVKPDHEIGKNEHGNRRFKCEAQRVKIKGRWQNVTPIIVCNHSEPAVEKKLAQITKDGAVMAIASRPFFSPNSQRAVYGENDISIRVHTPGQIAVIDSSYWLPTSKRATQLDLFAAPKVAVG